MSKKRIRLFSLILCLSMLLALALPANAKEEASETATEETRGPEKATPGIYDFVLEKQYVWIDRDRLSGKSLTAVMTNRALVDYYADNTLNWLYAADNLEFFKTEENKVSNSFAFGSTADYKWEGLRLGAVVTEKNKQYVSGYWVAFTLRAPEPGLYDVSLDYMVREDGTPEGEVYFLDGKYTDAIEIDPLLDEKALLGVTDFTGKSKDGKTYEHAATKQLGQIEVTQEEVTIVFRANSKVSEKSCCYMVITGIELAQSSSVDKTKDIMNMIAALDDSATRAEVEAVRKAYDSLSDLEKKYVTNAARLSAAETRLEQMEAQSKLITTIVTITAAVVAVSAVAAVVIVVVRKKAKK